MAKNLFYIIALLLSQSAISQFVSVNNLIRTGNFNCGAMPTITAQIITSEGSTVEDGNLVITDPCGFTTLRISMNNLRYNQPNANWPHGFFFPIEENIEITNVNLPAGWITQDSCTGASCSAQETGGVGFYYDGTNASSLCSDCPGTLNDGLPFNNYGMSSMSCNTPFSIQFNMTFCNSKVETTSTIFLLKGTSDGNTGCWTSPDGLEPNTISFSIDTVSSEIPLYDLVPANTEIITECNNGGLDLNYIAVFEGECGTGEDVTWWDAPSGGNLVGTGSPFLIDPEGPECPSGTVLYASCCPSGEGCERKLIVVGHCPPPNEPMTFSIDPICAGDPNPLPSTSNEGFTGSWFPSFNSYVSGTYTFTPDSGQCATYPETVFVEVLPVLTPTFAPVASICQFSTPPDLPTPENNTITGNWSPAFIDTDTPGTFLYTYTSDGDCPVDVTIEITIEEQIESIFELESLYCEGTEIITLPSTSDNGITGTWTPAVVDTSQPGTLTYTFEPDSDLEVCTGTITKDITIVPNAIPTFAPMNEICQYSTPPDLPQPIEDIPGTWFPETINTNTAGTFDFTFTPDGNCSESKTIQIIIVNEVTPTFNLQGTYCQNELPQDLNTISNNDVPGTWFPAEIDTETVGITTYTFTPEIDQCAVDISVPIEIYPLPVLNSLPPQYSCDNNFDGTYTINLSALNAQLGGGTGVSYRYFASVDDLNANNPIPNWQATNFPIASFPATVYVIGKNAQNCNSVPIAIPILKGDQVTYNAGPFGPINYCPEDTVNLTQFENLISTDPSVTFKYYATLEDARNEESPINNAGNYTPQASQMIAYVRLNSTEFCSALVEIQLNRFESPDLNVPDFSYLCDGKNIEVEATSSFPNATFEWTLEDGTIWEGAVQTISEVGTYTIIAYSEEGCRSETRSLTVMNPSSPVITGIEVEGSEVRVNAINNGEGGMEYSLDGVFWQDSNRFSNLIPGETYTIWVRSGGCMASKETITILGIPNFFSPNGDGINDTWEIRGLFNTPDASLKIFDRYGKIFVDTTFKGNYVWNGKYMGRSVSAGDYWYIIHIPSNGLNPETKYTGHVTIRNR